MRCDEFMLLLPSYPDIAENERVAFLAHAAQCESCALALAEQEALLSSLSALDEELEIPEAFTSGWRSAVYANAGAAPRARLSLSTRGWTLRGLSIAAAVVMFIFTGTAMTRRERLYTMAPIPDDRMRFELLESSPDEPEPLPASDPMPQIAAGSAAPVSMTAKPPRETRNDVGKGAEMEYVSDTLTDSVSEADAPLEDVVDITLSRDLYQATPDAVPITASTAWIPEDVAEPSAPQASTIQPAPTHALRAVGRFLADARHYAAVNALPIFALIVLGITVAIVFKPRKRQ
ncbi:MAG: zf-HC2 domain-containing protein [Clostridia bacterium]|nr:zf-HC2 domain-containing protein [Clostridia bacterium]